MTAVGIAKGQVEVEHKVGNLRHGRRIGDMVVFRGLEKGGRVTDLEHDLGRWVARILFTHLAKNNDNDT